jgi:hypothetical protein
MKLQKMSMSAAVLTAGAVSAIALGAGVANAAPSSGTATETISRLQANGNRVVVSKVGTGPMDQCSVTSVRSVVSSPAPTANPLTDVPNLQRITTVHVGLKC